MRWELKENRWKQTENLTPQLQNILQEVQFRLISCTNPPVLQAGGRAFESPQGYARKRRLYGVFGFKDQ